MEKVNLQKNNESISFPLDLFHGRKIGLKKLSDTLSESNGI